MYLIFSIININNAFFIERPLVLAQLLASHNHERQTGVVNSLASGSSLHIFCVILGKPR